MEGHTRYRSGSSEKTEPGSWQGTAGKPSPRARLVALDAEPFIAGHVDRAWRQRIVRSAPKLAGLMSRPPSFAALPCERGQVRQYVTDGEWEAYMGGFRVRVPDGTAFDGASVPGKVIRVAHTLTYPKHDPVVMPAALGHDVACYMRDPRIPYDVAADWFRQALVAMGAAPWKAGLMHRAVMSFGPEW